jgi:aspartyl-tRNA(Asn)/glutamyl-tRNA(Gln) amidotransferase subunit A
LSLGAELREISLPHTEYAIPTYYLIASAEASANLARFDGVRYTMRANDETLEGLYSESRDRGFGPEVKRRIMLGTYALAAGYYEEWYGKAQRVRRLIKEDFDRAFQEVELIIGPTSPTPAFKLGERIADPLQMYLSDVYTVPASLAGLPAISIPGGRGRGPPLRAPAHRPPSWGGEAPPGGLRLRAGLQVSQAQSPRRAKSPEAIQNRTVI